MSGAPELDREGHFPGCYSYGCDATLCAEARWMREYGRAEAARNRLPSHPDVSHADRPLNWEQRAIARAAEVLLSEGARDVALELLTYTRRR